MPELLLPKPDVQATAEIKRTAHENVAAASPCNEMTVVSHETRIGCNFDSTKFRDGYGQG